MPPGARLRARLQRLLLFQRLVPHSTGDHVDLRTGADLAGRAPAGCGRATAPSTRSTSSSGHRVRRPIPLGDRRARLRRRVAEGDVWADGGARPPRPDGARFPQPVRGLRPQHQPRWQLDHRHARGAGPAGSPRSQWRVADGGAHRSPCAATSGRRTTSRCRTGWAAGSGAGCDSWYRDGRRITTNWPGLVAEYQRRTATVDWAELEDVSPR